LTRQALDAKIAAAGGPSKSLVKGSTYSAYISDVLNITPAFNIMASLRADHFDNAGTLNILTGKTIGRYYQTTLSPKFGTVYQLMKDKLSLFGNYMNGFRNVAPAEQPFPDIPSTFKPQQANQLEGGVKMDLWNKKVNLTASVYDILVTN